MAYIRGQVEDYEIWLAENGSRDATARLAAGLAAGDPRIRTFSCAEPNYGAALREGIERAVGDRKSVV
mgnify:CR=1 FL=1